MTRTTATVAGGVAIGVAYTMSPLMVVFAAGLPWIVWRAIRGLPARERRWIAAVVTIAVVIRLLALAALLLTTDPIRHQFAAYFPDAHYAVERSWWIRNLWLGVPIGPHALFGIYDPYGASSFSYVLAAIQTVFGESPYGVNLVSVASIVLAGIVLHRFVRPAYGAMAALAAFAVIVLWPTMTAWSVSALREAPQVLLVAIVLAATASVVRGHLWHARLVAAAVVV